MTKADLIESVASKLDLPKGQAERAVNTIFDDIVGALRNGDKVNISGFGTFAVSARKALVLEDPDNYPKKLEPPPSEQVPTGAFQATVPPDAPDLLTH